MTTVLPVAEHPVRTTERISLRGATVGWWLAGAVGSLLIADGRVTIAFAAWLAPLCLMRFVRLQTRWRGLLIAYGVLCVTRGVTYAGMIPIPGIFYFIFLLISGFTSLLPFMADRFLHGRLSGFARTLVFPTALVTLQFFGSHGPFGTWGAWPYTQAGNLRLLQLLSVTGLWGITFLMGWFAAVINEVLEEGIQSRQAAMPLVVFAATLMAVVTLGGLRLALFPPSSTLVRVASLSPLKDGPPIPDELLHQVASGKASEPELKNFHDITTATQSELLARSEREAQAGAKIIFWSETAAYVLKADEPELFANARDLATKYKIYLGLAIGTWTPGAPHPLENKVVLFQPDGQIAWRFLKAHPTPGPEAAMAVKPAGKLLGLSTPYGRISTAICYDMDFATLFRQAGELPADVVISPAGDWRAIDPRHTEMASFRAIEEGFNLVRQANLGFSAAYDYQGHLLAAMHDYQSKDLALVAYVPVRGQRTLYSRWGDWFAWLCVIGLLTLIAVAVRSPYREIR